MESSRLYVAEDILLDPSTSDQRRSQRPKKPPTWMNDCVSGQRKAIVAHFTDTYLDFLANVSTIKEPSSFEKAQMDDNWIQAMTKELAALEENGTWELTTLHAGKKPIGSKWVYKVKLHPDGTLDRCKARLVAKGYNQIEGIDYADSFSLGDSQNYSCPCSCMVLVSATIRCEQCIFTWIC
ncbi:hypothetical protein Sjap_008001 [Stephania japonica]|uniref:Reverse transcriptase Ty1/copia-type domain-containing protein n=1 Tax=Stephania japonica TaxID=461633 RepID=A0AAP0PAY4_9MAGN